MLKSTIGLEIHIELNTKSKMFCGCLNDSDEKNPNINVCPICLGHPGTLPVINESAVRKVIKTGLALNCQILKQSEFDRKNYFYPDLPKGYQISQHNKPLCLNGFLKISNEKIRIRRIHLEEDTGRLIHEKDYSLVDFNRAGVPLMELVTEPDIKSAKEARKFAEELQLILRYLNVSSADMEKGQMRVEVNISLSKKQGVLGTKAEIKNLNSFRVVEKAIDYEIKRQTDLLNQGKKIIQETRGWHDNKQITFSQREKEESHDYRYFPEPDLPILRIGNSKSQIPNSKQIPNHELQISNEINIEKIKAEIPELPQERRERFKKEYNLLENEIEVFVSNKELGEFFEKVISELPPKLLPESLLKLIKLSSNYIITDLQGLIAKRGSDPAERGQTPLSKITPENFAEFIVLIYEEKISSKIAKIVLEEMFKTGADPSHIIEDRGLTQITNETEIEKIIQEVLLKNEKVIEDYKKGKTTAFQYLIGQIMSESKGKANPQIIQKLLTNLLKRV